MAANPETWGPKILARAVADAGGEKVAFTPGVAPNAPYTLPPSRPGPAPARELVVAHYRADLAWLARVPATVDRITVYAKGPECVVPDDSRIVVVPRPNVGREAEIIAGHCAAQWSTLAGLTLFTQDAPLDHSMDFLARLVHDYTRPTSLTNHYTDEFPPAWIKAFDRVESHFGHEVRYGDATIEGNGTGERGWFNAAAWDYLFDAPMPRPLYFGYGAMWAVPRAYITGRSRAFWAKLASEIVRGEASKPGSSWTDPPINPWSAEALWAAVFDPSIPVRAGFAGPVPVAGRASRAGIPATQSGAVAWGALEAVRACDYRQPLSTADQAACGCSGRITAVCLAGQSRRDDGRVVMSECLACIQSGGPS